MGGCCANYPGQQEREEAETKSALTRPPGHKFLFVRFFASFPLLFRGLGGSPLWMVVHQTMLMGVC